MRERIKVLFLASDPFRDRAAPRLDAEVRAVGRAMRGRTRVPVELAAHVAAHTRDLRDALLRHDPQIVHFAGDGGDPAVLSLCDAHGRRRRVGKEALGDLFGALSEWIRVVIMNGRDTRPTVEVLGGRVDYVIGMDRPLGDVSAIVFAGAFYGALATGRTVRMAFALAVRRLATGQRSGAIAPVLRIRPGVDPALPLVPRPDDAVASAANEDYGDARPPDARDPGHLLTVPRGRGALPRPFPAEDGPRTHLGAAFGHHFSGRAGQAH